MSENQKEELSEESAKERCRKKFLKTDAVILFFSRRRLKLIAIATSKTCNTEKEQKNKSE